MSSTRGRITTDSSGTQCSTARTGRRIRNSDPGYVGLTRGSRLGRRRYRLPPRLGQQRTALVFVFPRRHQLGHRYAGSEPRHVGAHPRRSSTTAIFMSSTRGSVTTDSFRIRFSTAQTGAPDTLVPNLNMSGSPSAVAWAGGITVFHQGTGDGQLWYTYSPDGTNWGGDTLVQNLGMSESPSAVVYNGLLYVFHQGSGDNGQLWYSAFDGANWAEDTLVQNVIWRAHPRQSPGPVALLSSTRETATDQLSYTYSPDGTNWGEDTLVQNLGMSCSPGCVTAVPITSIDYSIWSLQEPSGSGTSPTTISPSQLVAGYSDAYFYIAADGGQAFMDTQTGITTSGSTHCRTELREVTSSGAQAAWAPSGTNTMDVTGQVTLAGRWIEWCGYGRPSVQ